MAESPYLEVLEAVSNELQVVYTEPLDVLTQVTELARLSEGVGAAGEGGSGEAFPSRTGPGPPDKVKQTVLVHRSGKNGVNKKRAVECQKREVSCTRSFVHKLGTVSPRRLELNTFAFSVFL